MKVLVVDDSSTMRRIIANVLKEAGDYDAIEACDGVDALVKLNEHADIQLILTDWNMPNMNGLDFLTKVRETDKAVPIVMITTEAEKSNVLVAIKAGANNYIVKPFTPDTLKEKIGPFLK
jgi:two-component system chemotaxis response regulator CheY